MTPEFTQHFADLQSSAPAPANIDGLQQVRLEYESNVYHHEVFGSVIEQRNGHPEVVNRELSSLASMQLLLENGYFRRIAQKTAWLWKVEPWTDDLELLASEVWYYRRGKYDDALIFSIIKSELKKFVLRKIFCTTEYSAERYGLPNVNTIETDIPEWINRSRVGEALELCNNPKERKTVMMLALGYQPKEIAYYEQVSESALSQRISKIRSRI